MTAEGADGPLVTACGVLLMRETPERAFLLLCHPDRLDIPKGHRKKKEDDLTCALREMEEETGIPAAAVRIDPDFRYEQTYMVRHRKFDFELVPKKLVVFLGRLREAETAVCISDEHEDFEWMPWDPPHAIQTQTIDPLLDAVAQFEARGSD